MPTVHVALATVQARAITGATVPVVDSVPVASASQASAAASAVVAGLTGQPGQFWIVTATGGDVLVAFGADPDTDDGANWLLVGGAGPRDFAVKAAGEQIAIKSAA